MAEGREEQIQVDERIVIEDLEFAPLIGPDELHRGIRRVADELVERRRNDYPLMICVLNGAVFFHADLVRMMPIPLQIDFVRVASYHGGVSSSETITFTSDCGTETAGRNVIIVEDVIDTGRTVEYLRRHFLEKQAASVEVAALLYKPDADRFGSEPEYVVFRIPDRFVVGFGLDYRQQGRHLPAVYARVEAET